ncbi:MAG: hypothetical protein DI604_17950 [Delftia acidovorans]|nr:MAG: hypothetical protein DI604_17950 [Delftia acidovorans]
MGGEAVTVGEFRAWLDGFEAAMGGTPPNADQWKAIKDKLARVSEAPKAAFRDVKAPHFWPDVERRAYE